MRNSKKFVLLALVTGTLMVSSGCLNRVIYQATVQVVANAIGGFVPDLGAAIGG